MAVSFVGAASAATGDGTNPVIDLSGLGLQEGDAVYVGGGAGGFDGAVEGRADVLTAGYTPLADGYTSIPNAATAQRKVMGPAPDSSVTCAGGTGTTLNLGASYLAMVFRGVDTTTPEDVAVTDNDGGIDPPSVDPTTDDCMVLIFGLNAAVATLAAPTGYGNLNQQASNNGSADFTIAGATKLLSGHAAEDPGAFTGGADGVWAATIALRPAAAGGGAKPRTLSLLGVG